MRFYNTADRAKRVTFQTALLEGQAPNYGLYTINRHEIPWLSLDEINAMADQPYSQIADTVIWPYLMGEMPKKDFTALIEDAYDEKVIPVPIQHVVGNTYILWLTQGPTSSFKDFAARFFARALNYFAGRLGIKLIVVVATSGDTGPAIGSALFGLENIAVVIIYPAKNIYPGQRKQMSTLQGNVFAVEVVNGDFNLCQDMAIRLMNDKPFAKKIYGSENIFTSANSISLGRLLPQIVFPFYARSRIAKNDEKFVVSIASGNFGDMTGAAYAMKMGLPIDKIVVAVNENDEFARYLNTGEYIISPTRNTYSSAMDVNNPNNLPRLFDLYGGQMINHPEHKGMITALPNLTAMRRDLFAVSINNARTVQAIKDVYEEHKVIMDPHGAVGWAGLEEYLYYKHDMAAVAWETADPCKFPDVVKQATGVTPPLSPNMALQADLPERRFIISGEPARPGNKKIAPSEAQYKELQQIVAGQIRF